jgi:hypothetical protein
MNVTERTCANCANYEPTSPGEAPMCTDGKHIVLHQGTPQEETQTTRPGDTCDDHTTNDEVATVETQRQLSHLSLACLKALQEYGEIAVSLGDNHPNALAAWKRAETLDPSGYLARLMESHQAAQILAGASRGFVEAMHLAGHPKDTLGMDHPETSKALAQAMEIAPEGLKRRMHDMAVEMGLMPAIPDGYTDDGQPVYRLDGIADRLGISLEEAEGAAAAMVADRAAMGLPTEAISPDAAFHPIH